MCACVYSKPGMCAWQERPFYPFGECDTQGAVRDAAETLGDEVAMVLEFGNILAPAGTDKQ